jgi:hypothetical protein
LVKKNTEETAKRARGAAKKARAAVIEIAERLKSDE